MKNKSNAKMFYDSGKKYSANGAVRIKGTPFVNEEKQKIKEERKEKKLIKKALNKIKREEEGWN